MFNEILEYEFKNWKDYKYQIPFENSISYQIQIERIKEQTGHEYSANGVYFSWLLDLSIFHYQYANYAVFNLQDESIAKQHFALSSEYSYICLDYGSRSCECFKSKNIFIIMNKATFMLTNLLLSNETEKFNTIGKHLISSLNGAGCIIKKGYAKATISWFILKLFSLHAKEDITLHKLLLPKDTFPYDEVLKNWDTTDSNDINKYIELLCDAKVGVRS